MAWTDPRTWTDGELVTKAIMDTHIRDNFNNVGPMAKVRKTADETVVSSAVQQNDDHLFFSIGANEVWAFYLTLIMSNGNVGNADIVGGWTGPAGATAAWCGGYDATGLRTPTVKTLAQTVLWGYTSSTDILGTAEGFFKTVGTAGTIQFTWAQQISSGTSSVVRANSTLIAHRIT